MAESGALAPDQLSNVLPDKLQHWISEATHRWRTSVREIEDFRSQDADQDRLAGSRKEPWTHRRVRCAR